MNAKSIDMHFHPDPGEQHEDVERQHSTVSCKRGFAPRWQAASIHPHHANKIINLYIRHIFSFSLRCSSNEAFSSSHNMK